MAAKGLCCKIVVPGFHAVATLLLHRLVLFTLPGRVPVFGIRVTLTPRTTPFLKLSSLPSVEPLFLLSDHTGHSFLVPSEGLAFSP